MNQSTPGKVATKHSSRENPSISNTLPLLQ